MRDLIRGRLLEDRLYAKALASGRSGAQTGSEGQRVENKRSRTVFFFSCFEWFLDARNQFFPSVDLFLPPKKCHQKGIQREPSLPWKKNMTALGPVVFVALFHFLTINPRGLCPVIRRRNSHLSIFVFRCAFEHTDTNHSNFLI